ncbi:hypothetical protein pb186bvf_005935 [Paramecium bursaria]
MTFRWSNLEIQFNPQSIRYLNDMIWYHYSIAALIPLWIITIFKIITSLKGKNYPKTHISQYICHIFTVYGPFYYSFDASISIWEGTWFTQCRFPYFYHHIIAITVQPFLISKGVYNWTETLLCALHAVIVKYPNERFLLQLYLTSILVFNIQLYLNNQIKENRLVGKLFPFIHYCFVYLYIYEGACDSSLPYLAE